jgi:transcription antitermination factor NusG
MPVRTIDLLDKHQGKTVLLSGATSLSACVYPELVMSLSRKEIEENQLALKPETELTPGALVRVCSGSYEGVIGKINYLFSHQQRFPSGVRERAARIQLEDGAQLVVPLPVLERIG